MKNKIHFLLFFCSVLLSFQVNAQLDNNSESKKKGTSKNLLAVPSKTVKKPTSLDFNNKSGFKNAYKKEQEKVNKKKAEQAFNNKGIITPELLRKQTLIKQTEKYNVKIPMVDKDLGLFRTKSKNLIVSSFDFGMFDGDIVSISINGKKIVNRFTLTHQKKDFLIPLDFGFNRLEIIAEEEGSLRPNTGAFKVIDDANRIVIDDLWSLAKGAKVIAIVYREKDSKK